MRQVLFAVWSVYGHLHSVQMYAHAISRTYFRTRRDEHAHNTLCDQFTSPVLKKSSLQPWVSWHAYVYMCSYFCLCWGQRFRMLCAFPCILDKA